MLRKGLHIRLIVIFVSWFLMFTVSTSVNVIDDFADQIVFIKNDHMLLPYEVSILLSIGVRTPAFFLKLVC